MNTWFPDWTGKDTFFLILAILALVLSLEPIFNFRNRWKNWRARKSKDAFARRLVEKTKLMRRVLAYYDRPTDFFVDEMEDTVRFLIGLVLVAALFFLGYELNPFADWIEAYIGGFLSFVVTMRFLLERLAHLEYYRDPPIHLKEVEELIKEGHTKGWISEERFLELTTEMEAEPTKSS